MSLRLPRRTRLLIADDHPLFAESLAVLLAADPRLDVVGVAENGAEALELALELEPDVVLMDVNMPRLDGVRATHAIVSELPRVRVVMLSSSAAVEDVERSHRAGACAYLTKDADAASITREVLRAAAVPLTPARAA